MEEDNGKKSTRADIYSPDGKRMKLKSNLKFAMTILLYDDGQAEIMNETEINGAKYEFGKNQLLARQLIQDVALDFILRPYAENIVKGVIVNMPQVFQQIALAAKTSGIVVPK